MTSKTKFAGVTLVGCREGDPSRRHIPDSGVRPCDSCSRPTVFSQASIAAAEAYSAPIRFVCVECTNLTNHVVAEPTPEQKAEVKAAGYDASAWALQNLWGKLVKRHEPG